MFLGFKDGRGSVREILFAVNADQGEEKRENDRGNEDGHDAVDFHAAHDAEEKKKVGELDLLSDDRRFKKVVDQADKKYAEEKQNARLHELLLKEYIKHQRKPDSRRAYHRHHRNDE